MLKELHVIEPLKRTDDEVVSYGKTPMNSDAKVEEIRDADLLKCTVDVVIAHVSNNDVASEELPELLRNVYSALANVDPPAPPPARPKPAVPISKSVTPDYIVCLEDGKKLRVLKRYLKRNHGLSIEDYRDRWNLPDDYPVVAPNYSRERRKLAKEIGLGTKFRRPSQRKAS